jgi:hypothetical protein
LRSPELSRTISPSKINSSGLDILVCATPEERAAVASRMDLPAIQYLQCHFHLTLENDGISVHSRGRLRAVVVRICVVSAEEFEAMIEEEFEVRFVAAGKVRIALNPDEIDEIPFETGVIDLGEAAAEQLGLALDPYPRMDGVAMPDYDRSE